MTKHDLNVLLYQLLGSEELVSLWWHSPNRRWDNRAPYAVWCEQSKKVEDYILGFVYKEQS